MWYWSHLFTSFIASDSKKFIKFISTPLFCNRDFIDLLGWLDSHEKFSKTLLIVMFLLFLCFSFCFFIVVVVVAVFHLLKKQPIAGKFKSSGRPEHVPWTFPTHPIWLFRGHSDLTTWGRPEMMYTRVLIWLPRDVPGGLFGMSPGHS